MGSCYSGDHIAAMHTDITTCNIEEPQHRSNALERSVMDYDLGVGWSSSLFTIIELSMLILNHLTRAVRMSKTGILLAYAIRYYIMCRPYGLTYFYYVCRYKKKKYDLLYKRSIQSAFTNVQ